MKSFLNNTSKRQGYDGWALKVEGASKVLRYTVSTTRAEVRQIQKERRDMFKTKIVKVSVSVSEVSSA